MATIIKDKPIAEKAIRPGMNQKLVGMDIQRLSIFVFIVCVSRLPETFILFKQKGHNGRFQMAGPVVAGRASGGQRRLHHEILQSADQALPRCRFVYQKICRHLEYQGAFRISARTGQSGYFYPILLQRLWLGN
jgi:hypothetical protein